MPQSRPQWPIEIMVSSPVGMGPALQVCPLYQCWNLRSGVPVSSPVGMGPALQVCPLYQCWNLRSGVPVSSPGWKPKLLHAVFKLSLFVGTDALQELYRLTR